MGAEWRLRVIGRCYFCRQPVRAAEAERVTDMAVRTMSGQPVRRLAHAGDCANTLRGRVGSRFR